MNVEPEATLHLPVASSLNSCSRDQPTIITGLHCADRPRAVERIRNIMTRWVSQCGHVVQLTNVLLSMRHLIILSPPYHSQVTRSSFEWEYIVGKGGFGRVKAVRKKVFRVEASTFVRSCNICNNSGNAEAYASSLTPASTHKFMPTTRTPTSGTLRKW